MSLNCGDLSFNWIENWARIPDTHNSRNGWSHHDIVVTESGDIMSGHPEDPVILTLDTKGNIKDSWPSEVCDAHGMTLVKEQGNEYLWIADPGRKRRLVDGYEYPENNRPVKGKTIKKTLSGKTVMTLEPPHLPVYTAGDFMPTSVVVNEQRFGGTGDIWVSDGYGAYYIHRYNSNGSYLNSINGEEGNVGHFNNPHGIFIDRRKQDPEMYIGDRANNLVQVYDLDGTFKRSFGQDFLITPSAFATLDNFLIVAELKARLAILDADDNLVCYIGANQKISETTGWPNKHNDQGTPIRTTLLQDGLFNSPHGLAVDSTGNLYIAEWLIGGRFIKLHKE